MRLILCSVLLLTGCASSDWEGFGESMNRAANSVNQQLAPYQPSAPSPYIPDYSPPETQSGKCDRKTGKNCTVPR